MPNEVAYVFEIQTMLAASVNISEQAVEAREQGLLEVVRLLQQPEDLARLAALRAEYDQRHRHHKQQLSGTIQAQVEAARFGLELLDKSHRNIARLRAVIDRIDHMQAVQ